MKIITIENMYDIDQLLSEVEEKLRNSVLNDECYLINNLRSYLRLKRDRLK